MVNPRNVLNIQIISRSLTVYIVSYCQAQPQSQLSWAELALVFISPAAHPPVLNSSEIAGKEKNLFLNSCRCTLLELKIIKEISKDIR